MRCFVPWLVMVVACGSPNKDEATTPTSTSETGVETTDTEVEPTDPETFPSVDPVVTWSEYIASVPSVDWEPGVAPGSAASSWVEFGLDNLDNPKSTPPVVGEAPHVSLLGLKAGRTYQWRAVSELDGERIFESAVESLEVPEAPPGLPVVSVTVNEPNATTTGGFYLTTMPFTDAGSWAVIFDGDGDPVWYHRAGPNHMVARLRPGLNGTDVLWSEYDLVKEDESTELYRAALDGTKLERTRMVWGHHDFTEHPDGTIGWLAFTIEETDAGGDTNDVILDHIYEGAEGNLIDDPDDPGIHHLFSWREDYGHEIWYECPDQAADTNIYGMVNGDQWTHSNSLMFLESQNAYYVNARFLDAILKVDRATGEVLWQLGGRYSDFTHPGGDAVWREYFDLDLFSHGHMSHIWEDGFVMFDNGDHLIPERSRISEYRYDEATMTVEKIWEMEEPNGEFVSALGDVRKLENGNYLTAWSKIGVMNEVTPDREIVWQMEADVFFSRVFWTENLYDLTTAQ